METGFKHLHSYFAYIVLAGLIIVFLYNLMAHLNNKRYTEANRKATLIGMLLIHVQLIFGILNYFTSPYGFKNLNSEAMKNSAERLLILEHPLMMIIAAILITIGNSKSKKAITDRGKYKAMLLYFGIALVLILIRLPWANWFD